MLFPSNEWHVLPVVTEVALWGGEQVMSLHPCVTLQRYRNARFSVRDTAYCTGPMYSCWLCARGHTIPPLGHRHFPPAYHSLLVLPAQPTSSGSDPATCTASWSRTNIKGYSGALSLHAPKLCHIELWRHIRGGYKTTNSIYSCTLARLCRLRGISL